MNLGAFLNFVGFQTVWLSCILGAAAGRPAFGPVVAGVLLTVHLTQTRRWRAEATLIVLAGIVGYAADSLLVLGGAMSFPPTAVLGGPSTVWMVTLWMAFAATLNEAFGWLAGRYATGAVLGAIAGPLSYGAGARLGAVELAAPLPGSLALVAVEWAIALPLLLLLARLTSARLNDAGLVNGGTHPALGSRP